MIIEERDIKFSDNIPPKYENSILTVKPPTVKPQHINVKENTKVSTSKRKDKCCYSKESHDSRCCGGCYWLCPSDKVKERCECCPNNFCDYWKSGYIQTIASSVRSEDRCNEFECDDCFCTIICFPVKFPIFSPCCIGSILNELLNKLCNTNRNYLF